MFNSQRSEVCVYALCLGEEVCTGTQKWHFQYKEKEVASLLPYESCLGCHGNLENVIIMCIVTFTPC